MQADSSITRKYGGTGLGLSISSQLVRIMGGELCVASVEGKGSAFSFTAPFKPGRHAGYPAAAGSPPLSPLPGKRVLLVEDIATNRALAVRLLKRKGHAVATAANGKEALRILEQEAFDVVLMDIQMPEMDGYDAARTIRDPHSSVLDHHVPILALTAHSMPEDRARCAAAGMNGYLSKPLKSHELLAAVEHYSAGPESVRSPEFGDGIHATGGTDAVERPESDRSVDIGVGSPALDAIRNELLKRYEGDSSLVEELLELFRGELPGLLRKIQDALDARNSQLLEMHAHACKSAAGAVGFNSLLELSRQIEQSAKSGDFETARSAYQRLAAETRIFM
jgi:hypothetical protein